MKIINVERILDFLKVNGYSKKKFCDLSGVSIYYFNKVLNDDVLNLGINGLFKIAKAMDVDIVEILRKEESMD